jgi:hypothetical protein
MPRRKKKPVAEQTTEEAIERLFPKKVRDKAKEDAKTPRSPAKLSIEKKPK